MSTAPCACARRPPAAALDRVLSSLRTSLRTSSRVGMVDFCVPGVCECLVRDALGLMRAARRRNIYARVPTRMLVFFDDEMFATLCASCSIIEIEAYGDELGQNNQTQYAALVRLLVSRASALERAGAYDDTIAKVTFYRCRFTRFTRAEGISVRDVERGLGRCRALHMLAFERCALTDAGTEDGDTILEGVARLLVACPRLRVISLSGAVLRERSLVALLAAARHARKDLHLSLHAILGTLPERSLIWRGAATCCVIADALAAGTRIRTLEIGQCWIGQGAARLLGALARTEAGRALSRLSLNQCFHESCTDELAELVAANTNLRSFSFSPLPLDLVAVAARLASALEHNTHLETLSLYTLGADAGAMRALHDCVERGNAYVSGARTLARLAPHIGREAAGVLARYTRCNTTLTALHVGVIARDAACIHAAERLDALMRARRALVGR